ncbi:MAG: homoserine kinase [Candidatus Obscuribacter sp.]|nr:homoserine kinase [Candidatus Obscuribacter sp.]MBP6349684.1 homoserine kinase [Candidatus Obscuribacter sp.]MBP6593513.1 homoserine kinase [Candidatus Obscuribacter sp.]MBP7577576.1 homoserine kinase [Candidatus Obscuribacter sp.]MDQ5963857.1 Homoserine kinase [Cyanobacteriota bacterium erpe_2018_sw_39hr_WHONDRS-SW48-000098_B_bin.30]
MTDLVKNIDKLLTRGRKITLKLPGTTSNLGPGLDCLGLALNVYSEMSFFLLEDNDPNVPLITFRGGIAKSSLSQDQGDLTYTILSKLWQRDHHLLDRVRIMVDSEIPLGAGLGASSTAIIGALWAANVLKDKIPTAPSLLAEGCELEGHPETLSACLLGGLVVCSPGQNGRVITQRLKWPEDWRLLVAMPPYTLNTQVTRAVLPRQVRHEDAMYNVQRVAQLIAAVARADEACLKDSMEDRLHEPFRSQLVPELALLKRELVNEPIMGCFLSGAGSSVVTVVHKRHKDAVIERINDWNSKLEKPGKILDLKADEQGIQELEV